MTTKELDDRIERAETSNNSFTEIKQLIKDCIDAVAPDPNYDESDLDWNDCLETLRYNREKLGL